MLEVILGLTVVNTILQLVAVWQRHATLQVHRKNGNGGGVIRPTSRGQEYERNH